jgi:hypothetical protein
VGRTRGAARVASGGARSVLYHVIATGQPYHDLGADYLTTRVDPERRARQLARQLADLGYKVTLTKAA